MPTPDHDSVTAGRDVWADLAEGRDWAWRQQPRLWERVVTCIHEAGHATVADQLGVPVREVVIGRDGRSGYTVCDGTGLAAAVVSVAGVRATRFFCAETHGGQLDYLLARDALAGTGADLVWAETHADQLIQAHRWDLLRLARRLHRHGRA